MRRSTAWLAILVSVAIVLSGSGCGEDHASMTYSVDEVLEAFEAVEYPLVESPLPGATTAAANGGYLFPRDGAPVSVFVATDQEADDAWPDYVRLGGDEDSLTIRRANVLAISDGGLSSVANGHVRAGMDALPDKGYAVDVLEDR